MRTSRLSRYTPVSDRLVVGMVSVLRGRIMALISSFNMLEKSWSTHPEAASAAESIEGY